VLRCAKNSNGVIIAMGNDENQSGNYPSEGDMMGTWCSWTVAEGDLPAFAAVNGADERAMRFEENLDGDGIELRTDEEIIATPDGIELPPDEEIPVTPDEEIPVTPDEEIPVTPDE